MNAVGVTTHVELESDLPLVMGHQGQLQEVMINLLENAIEAMKTVKNGHRKLHLTTSQLTGEMGLCFNFAKRAKSK